MSKFYFCSLLVLFLSFSSFGQSQQSAATPEAGLLDKAVPQSIFETLSTEERLQITLTADFSYLLENKYDENYQQAFLSYSKNDGNQQLEVKVRARGKFRRKTCDFPPLKLKFKKGALKDLGIRTNHKSLKLVTHCMDAPDAEQNLIKEYLAYQMFNTLTDQSFRVKLIEVTYQDAKGVEEPVKRMGFLIENTNEMAERLGGEECEQCYNTQLSQLDVRYCHLLTMFQYMIGNTDWNPQMMHNVKVVNLPTQDKPVLVPYDFDFSGLVNASYARPNPDYKQTDIRQRIYMHKVEDFNEVKPIIRFFKVKEKEILQLVKDNDYLTKKNKRDTMQFLRSFFSLLDNPDAAKMEFVKDKF